MPKQSQPITFNDGISRKDLKTIRSRFLKLHRERLQRILAELNPNRQDLFNLLPLLFHINHPMLPGYVNSETPKGLPDYTPTKRVLDIARKYSRSFQYKRRAQRIFEIEALYLMGSSGTVGQSSSSDFDLWLCHSPDLDKEKQALLQQKASLIEQAAAEVSLELHIFLINPEQFRQGQKGKLSHESSGSTQHGLLLEEFYRSAILLAGRYPLWWLVPPDQELNYQAYTANLLHQRFVKNGEALDLGGLDQVPAEEFFGAALWQLYKGIDSPYKSILKIFLMEAYSRDFPHPQWIAQQAKQAIYTDQTDLQHLDAYVLLYRRVEAYLTEINDQERLELARRSFYFKVGEQLSRDSNLQHWRSETLFEMTRQWGWSQSQLQSLDSRAEWKIDKVINERNVLVGVLSRSYRLLTDFTRKYATQSRIDPMELNLLGRKLFTALDHRPGKIDHINPAISRNIAEEHLSLHHRPSRSGELVWMLYRGQVETEQAPEHRPIKVTSNLIENLLWSHINQVWGGQTRVSLYPKDCVVSRRELLDLYKSLKHLYPVQRMPSAGMQALTATATLIKASLFVNIGIDPLEHLSKDGMQLTSDRHDPFSFASTRTNLVMNLEALLQTSWGELLISRHEGPDGLLGALCSILNLLDTQHEQLPEISAYCFSSVRGSQISARLVELINNILRYFTDRSEENCRYAFQLAREFYIVQKQAKGFEWRRIESFESLLDELMQPQASFHSLAFDPEILRDTPYPLLYQLNRPDVIQLFYQRQAKHMQIYLLDEEGALFQQSLAMDSPRFLMMQQRRFLNSLQQLRNLMPGNQDNLLKEPEFYEIGLVPPSGWTCTPKRVPLTRPDDYMELTLVTDRLDASAHPLSLVCGGRDFNQIEYGDEIYQATAHYLQSLREGNESYPIYLTSLRFSGLQIIDPPRTVELLNLKKRIEARLNRP
ncbi:MAG: class I adenylate cyclase [Gammaproteobacteria bacterium]|nr:class I adenylate cyclase [Gammaproteobacteria bacterium]